jgi:NAD(P)-dependent dehydrogenase (short-subunit alcohol dehydrogenase family)
MVVLVGRRPEPLKEVADTIGAAGGVAQAFPADIRDWDRLGELQEAITGWSGRVDVVVNAAGGQFHVPAEQLTPNARGTGGGRQPHRTLALEWASHGIRVNALSPGFTDTPAFRSQVGDLSGPVARVPLRRVASVEEVADAALFLARSTYTTGEVLTVDGGFQLI